MWLFFFLMFWNLVKQGGRSRGTDWNLLLDFSDPSFFIIYCYNLNTSKWYYWATFSTFLFLKLNWRILNLWFGKLHWLITQYALIRLSLLVRRNYQVLALCRAWNCVLLMWEGGQKAPHEIDICLRSGILDEAQCGVLLKNKCQVS